VFRIIIGALAIFGLVYFSLRLALARRPVTLAGQKRKGADARHQTVKELANPSDGALDTATVLRVFLRRVRWNAVFAFSTDHPAILFI
jgi:hypothetical protein